MKNTGENLFASPWKANANFIVKGWVNEGKESDAIPVSCKFILEI